MKKVFIVLVLLVAIAGGGFAFLTITFNNGIKAGIEGNGSEMLKTNVSVESVNVSFLSGSGTINGVRIEDPKDKGQYAFEMGQLHIEIAANTDEKIHLKKVVVDSPKIAFVGDFGKSNLTVIQENLKSGTPPKKNLQIDSLQIRNGEISASMRRLRGQKLVINLPDLELRDIGKGDKSMPEAMQEIFPKITEAIIDKIKTALRENSPFDKKPERNRPELPKPPFGNEKPDDFPKPPFDK